MNPGVTWQQLYQAAFLESNPQDLRRRIDASEKAIRERMASLQPDDPAAAEECRALEDALRGLRGLERREFPQPVRPEMSGDVPA